jgi:hypothetical protein
MLFIKKGLGSDIFGGGRTNPTYSVLIRVVHHGIPRWWINLDEVLNFLSRTRMVYGAQLLLEVKGRGRSPVKSLCTRLSNETIDTGHG